MGGEARVGIEVERLSTAGDPVRVALAALLADPSDAPQGERISGRGGEPPDRDRAIIAALTEPTDDRLADELLALLAPLLVELVATLTPRQRTVARLLIVEGRRQADVAERLGVRRATVSALVARSRIRAIERLARALQLILGSVVRT